MSFQPTPIDSKQAIINPDGTPTFFFQRVWEDAQRAVYDTITAIPGVQEAIVAAQEAADLATAAAGNADSASSLATSGTSGLTITATDAGSNVTVSISAHTRVYGDGTSVSVNAGTVTGLAYSTVYYIYYDQASRAGGTVTYQATTTQASAAQTGDRHSLGAVTTPAALGGPVDGSVNLPPGVVLP